MTTETAQHGSGVYGWSFHECEIRLAGRISELEAMNGQLAGLLVKRSLDLARAESERQRVAEMSLAAVAEARRRERITGWAALFAIGLMAILVLTIR